jgi:hypothetical protein
MDGTTRLLLVGGAVALVVYFAWPYVRGEMGEIGRQVGNVNHSGVTPWDPLGLMPGQSDRGYAERGDRRLRLPEGVGSAAGDYPRQSRYAPPGQVRRRPGLRTVLPGGTAPVQPVPCRGVPAGAGDAAMVERTRIELALVVTWERVGEPAERHLALSGERALIVALRTIIAHPTLRAGDRLTVKAAD